MASSREAPASRPMSGSLSRPVSSSRPHSHSVSLGAANPAHRINRRKSMNQSTANNAAAALVAALKVAGGDASAVPINSHRRSLGSRKGTESTSMGHASSMGTNFSRPNFGHIHTPAISSGDDADDAVEDHIPADKASTKNRNRRASEGSYLVKSGGKRVSAEVHCEKCGKSYKHSSCLTKHMWEHDPAWAQTSKFLISKHQQVQMLEAASTLLNITEAGSAVDLPEQARVQESEGSSVSPGYTGSSDMQEELSSAETSPPPMSDTYAVPDAKRTSASSAAFSRSYRSNLASSYGESVISPGLPPHRYSVEYRPGTSGTDDGGLAAAAELLNFGTPRTRASVSFTDVPPVPPLPERYQSARSLVTSSLTPTMYNPLGMHPPALTQQLSEERDSKEYGHIDGETFSRRRSHQDEEIDEMFRMEE